MSTCCSSDDAKHAIVKDCLARWPHLKMGINRSGDDIDIWLWDINNTTHPHLNFARYTH